jgi:hypothetical protein
MSAVELIKQVAALPQQERTLFEQLFQAMKTGNDAVSDESPAQWPNFNERLHHIYGDRIAPDSQNIIDEGRGER